MAHALPDDVAATARSSVNDSTRTGASYPPADAPNRVLMIAFQFPPFAGSSAVQRTLRFVRYLPEFGWLPLVLTASPRAYAKTSEDLLAEVPGETVVERAFSLDSARHLGVFRRYPAVLARPDRWISWLPAAVWSGLRMIRSHRPRAIWSTFPIPTAHLIAYWLHRHTGIPWIADFRDPMVQPNDPPDPHLWKAYERVERKTVARAQLNVFTTEGTRALYEARYPEIPGNRFAVVENGYDEDAFAGLPEAATARDAERLLLVHSGAIYPLERDPTHLFRALQRLRAQGAIAVGRLCVRLRATGHDGAIGRLLQEHGVGDLVELAPPLPYREALLEMTQAGGLLVLQADEVRTQIPAKLYEYLRAGRPILALTDPESDTGRLLRKAGVEHIVRLDSTDDIARVMMDFMSGVRARTLRPPDPSVVRQASRRRRSGELASLLRSVVGGAAPGAQ